MQTTYENFRFRYDKKENPYNRGIIRNLKEIFLSKIPPSMNDFRSLVWESEPNPGGSITPSKEKIDIEMGAKLAEERVLSLPEILRSLDYDGVDDDDDDYLKIKEGEGKTSFDLYDDDSQVMDEGVNSLDPYFSAEHDEAKPITESSSDVDNGAKTDEGSISIPSSTTQS